MSCNGCRVLRKGCSESCILRPCLQWIESPEAQGHATVFVAKFFGRAGLMSFISSVPETQRPALFQSLLFEACGRTVNPVNGAVGLLWTGNWHVCQTAVDTILRGGTLRPISDVLGGILLPESDEKSEVDLGCGGSGGDHNQFKLRDRYFLSKRKPMDVTNNLNRLQAAAAAATTTDLDLSLTPRKVFIKTGGGGGGGTVKTRPATPSMNSEDSVTTTSDSGGRDQSCSGEKKLLNLFV